MTFFLICNVNIRESTLFTSMLGNVSEEMGLGKRHILYIHDLFGHSFSFNLTYSYPIGSNSHLIDPFSVLMFSDPFGSMF